MMNTNIIDLEELANVVGGQSYDSYDLLLLIKFTAMKRYYKAPRSAQGCTLWGFNLVA